MTKEHKQSVPSGTKTTSTKTTSNYKQLFSFLLFHMRGVDLTHFNTFCTFNVSAQCTFCIHKPKKAVCFSCLIEQQMKLFCSHVRPLHLFNLKTYWPI